MTKKRLVALLALIIPIVLYCYTAAPDIYWEDSAALQTASAELGIVHNPSFPIYVMMGRLFTLLPFASGGGMVNILSALLGAFSIFFLFLITKKVTRIFYKEESLIPAIFSLIFSGLLLTLKKARQKLK